MRSIVDVGPVWIARSRFSFHICAFSASFFFFFKRPAPGALFVGHERSAPRNMNSKKRVNCSFSHI